MEGFFKTSTKKQSRPQGKSLSCVSCQLYKNAESPKMEPFGEFKKGIMNIGEAPGKKEDERGQPWQGKVGRVLQRAYRKVGIDLFEDCVNVNAVNCRPPNNKTPSPFQVMCCKNVMVEKAINDYDPSVIVLLGGAALQSYLSERWRTNLGGIFKWRGFTIPDQQRKAWVCPVFHPSFVERAGQEAETVWMKDLERIAKLTAEPVPRLKQPTIHYEDSLDFFDSIKTQHCAFDYETTGIKPQGEDHKIYCVSAAPDTDTIYTAMLPDSRRELRPLKRFLMNQNIYKIASNMKYEEIWSNVILKTPVAAWGWDTMLAAHLLDNRKGTTGLKFQAFINFGMDDYSSEIESYLKAKDSNSVNTIHKLLERLDGKEKLLKYCAWDSLLEYRLAMKQMEEIDYDYLPF